MPAAQDIDRKGSRVNDYNTNLCRARSEKGMERFLDQLFWSCMGERKNKHLAKLVEWKRTKGGGGRKRLYIVSDA